MTVIPVSTPLWVRTYLSLVVAAGLLAIGTSILDVLTQPFRPAWLSLAALTLLTGSFSIKLPSINARISVSEAFVFVAVLLFGPAVATMVVVLDTIILTSWTPKARRSPLRAAFNVSAGATAIWLASHFYEFLIRGRDHTPALEDLLLPVLGLASSYFVINSWLIAVAIGQETGTSPFRVWQRNFAWLSLNYLGGGSVAMLLVAYRPNIDLTALGVIVPLLVITYLTFRTSLARLKDAQDHVAQLNELYLSTVETLAMAVDAKDQITHGHIRRVQVYAFELAKRLGVSDEAQLKAIEAAALLHDVGKLAIPEHILNKPGKLSAAEFESMKRHASIGADLLSSIKFPYPVVPIVRHHHECWDGSGYPAGISGSDIPLGARILSVVDCFDALTSDRPYRPRLQHSEAFSTLRERRGSMYDPLVVDTFITSYEEIAPKAITAGQQAKSSFLPLYGPQVGPSAPGRDSTHGTSPAMARFSAELGLRSDLSTVAEATIRHVRLLTPAVTCVFFRRDFSSDSMICMAADGENAELLADLRICLGERITGWVAAHGKVALNSDARLDLPHLAHRISPTLRSALAGPVRSRDSVIGVVTAYATAEGAFHDEHRRIFEEIIEMLSRRVATIVALNSYSVIR